MVTTGNESTFPYFSQDEGRDIIGLTKREHFALQMALGEETYKPELVKTLMGGEDFPSDPIENIKYWDRFEAMRKLMKADALIAELNKEVKP